MEVEDLPSHPIIASKRTPVAKPKEVDNSTEGKRSLKQKADEIRLILEAGLQAQAKPKVPENTRDIPPQRPRRQVKLHTHALSY
jgi:hypothetical protein